MSGRHLKGSFSTEVAAARFRSKATGTRAKVMKHTIKTRKRARDVFAAAYAAFKSYIPGDLVVTREQESDSALNKAYMEYIVLVCCLHPLSLLHRGLGVRFMLCFC